MKKWQLEIIVVLVAWFSILLFTGYGVGFQGGVILGVPLAWISGKIWDKYYAKYECKICNFKGTTKEEIREHIKTKHKDRVK